MRPVLLAILLAVAVATAGYGALLLTPPSPPGLALGWFGSIGLPRRYATYAPLDAVPTGLDTALGLVLLALGAGTAGAAVAALVLGRPRRIDRRARATLRG